MAAQSRIVIGLISGTSADGIDAALVELGQGKVECRSFITTAYSDDLRSEVLSVSIPEGGSTDRICRLHAVLGEWFARAAFEVCRNAGLDMSEVDLIGSHGQTVHHLPDPWEGFGTEVRSTLQLGDPSRIAERTGVTTVADFRSRDVAAGGQGAPLIPLVDFLLLKSDERGRVLLNIGGIANVTVLPAGCSRDEVYAFDTGPGNMLLDGLVHHLTDGQLAFDRDGRMASDGKVDGDLLGRLMDHPFLALPPPKSTGREDFGEGMVDELIRAEPNVDDADLLATVAAFTTESIARAVGEFVLPERIEELVVSGGGTKNPVLMGRLRDAIPPRIGILRTDDLGIPSDAKEAIGFAVLANETIEGRSGNLRGATGAERDVPLGIVVPGSGLRFSVDRKA